MKMMAPTTRAMSTSGNPMARATPLRTRRADTSVRTVHGLSFLGSSGRAALAVGGSPVGAPRTIGRPQFGQVGA